MLARAALEPEGRWDALRADRLALYESFNEETDGSLRLPGDYEVTIASRPE